MKTNLLKQVFILPILFVAAMNKPNVDAAKSLKNTISNHGKLITFANNKADVNSSNFKQEIKTFKFGEIRSGDCVMAAGGTLVIYSDGRAEFRATVWTNHTHSGDTWHHHVFFKNSASGTIFEITLEGPNHMNDDGSRYAFSSSFNFPAGLFYAVSTISVVGQC